MSRIEHAGHAPQSQAHEAGSASYARFAAMLFRSTAVMFVIMAAFMLGMYADRRRNTAIFLVSAALFGGFLYLARSQRTVDDVAWMKAMIPREIAEMEALLEQLDRR